MDFEISVAFELMSHYDRITVTVMKKMDDDDFKRVTHIGVDHFLPIRERSTCCLNTDLYYNYSYCHSWDPVFGIQFDDKDNGLMTLICNYLEQVTK